MHVLVVNGSGFRLLDLELDHKLGNFFLFAILGLISLYLLLKLTHISTGWLKKFKRQLR